MKDLKLDLVEVIVIVYNDFASYLLVYMDEITMFGEHMPKSFIDKVIKFRGDSLKIN